MGFSCTPRTFVGVCFGIVYHHSMGEDITVGELANHLGIARVTLSNILNGKAGISAAMAVKLSQAFPPSEPQLWLRLQSDYELSRELRNKRKPIAPARRAA